MGAFVLYTRASWVWLTSHKVDLVRTWRGVFYQG